MKKYNFQPSDFKENSTYAALFGDSNLRFVAFPNFLHLNIRDANAYTGSEDGKSKVTIPNCTTRIKHYFTQAEEEIEHEDGTKERIVKEIFERSEVIVGLPADQLCEGYVFIR